MSSLLSLLIGIQTRIRQSGLDSSLSLTQILDFLKQTYLTYYLVKRWITVVSYSWRNKINQIWQQLLLSVQYNNYCSFKLRKFICVHPEIDFIGEWNADLWMVVPPSKNSQYRNRLFSIYASSHDDRRLHEKPFVVVADRKAANGNRTSRNEHAEPHSQNNKNLFIRLICTTLQARNL